MSEVLKALPAVPGSRALLGLIVEDQALIGLSLEAFLEELGIQVGGMFVCEEAALSYLESTTPDFAILDYSLAKGPCTQLAEALRARNVPVIVYSGHACPPGTAPEFAGAVWIEKPASRATIVDAILRRVIPGGHSSAGAESPLPAAVLKPA